MSAAGLSQGRPCARGEAEARRARPRAWTVADATPPLMPRHINEAAGCPPLGGTARSALGGIQQ
jgi:hypothetical protein